MPVASSVCAVSPVSASLLCGFSVFVLGFLLVWVFLYGDVCVYVEILLPSREVRSCSVSVVSVGSCLLTVGNHGLAGPGLLTD